MRILLIEDEEQYLSQLVSEVEKDYLLDVANSGTEGTYLTEVNDYDVIVVDASLPDIAGEEVCKITRSANVTTPILFLNTANDVNSKIASLEAGADACISKPINALELKANLKALVRRNKYNYAANKMRFGNLEIDTNCREVKVSGDLLYLRRKEYEILEYLVLNKNKVVTKEKLLDHVWRDGLFVMSNTVEVHIKSLRDKIDRPYSTYFIQTVRGFGYKFSDKN